ncbi:hypothetical protein QQ020_22975 [Fulvivirgaceae bacterium BMA12]|uniref:Uncharacterized protein n=1 Tax=Agaribacillus aureus TaxID=3051825 RepID=A0ABT8LB17_9BACT|nr:hypothetical protein [Fulvivirgaceae bacterium BMA12]
MTAILGFLYLGLFIVFIAGLINPALVLRWTNKPTRLKVFGYWIFVTFLVGMLGFAIENDGDKAKSIIKTALTAIEEENYENAISNLKKIDEENPLFLEAQKLVHRADSLNRKRKEAETKRTEEEEKLKQREQLEREIASIDHGVDFSTYRGSVQSLQIELVLFGSWADIITKSENSKDLEIQSLAKQLRLKVMRLQIREFPKLRNEYVKVVNQKMWENDIDVYASGTGNRYINFSGGIFAANKNKKDFHVQLHEVLTMFRFSQARYRWYKEADKYTYWTIYEGKDSDLITFD